MLLILLKTVIHVQVVPGNIIDEERPSAVVDRFPEKAGYGLHVGVPVITAGTAPLAGKLSLSAFSVSDLPLFYGYDDCRDCNNCSTYVKNRPPWFSLSVR